jgi:hypothetical protein
MNESVVFLVAVIVLILVGILGIVIYTLKVNELFPFRKMKDKDLKDCYDMSLRNGYDQYQAQKMKNKKK